VIRAAILRQLEGFDSRDLVRVRGDGGKSSVSLMDSTRSKTVTRM